MRKYTAILTVLGFLGAFMSLSLSELMAETIYEKPTPETYTLDSMTFRNPFTPLFPIKKIVEKIVPPEPVEVQNATVPIQNTAVTSAQTSTPIQAEVVPPPTLVITGIVWNTTRPQAIINGQVVDVGDSIQNTAIMAIRKNEVDVQFNGTILTITL